MAKKQTFSLFALFLKFIESILHNSGENTKLGDRLRCFGWHASPVPIVSPDGIQSSNNLPSLAKSLC